jgi:cation transporter-like permease
MSIEGNEPVDLAITEAMELCAMDSQMSFAPMDSTQSFATKDSFATMHSQQSFGNLNVEDELSFKTFQAAQELHTSLEDNKNVVQLEKLLKQIPQILETIDAVENRARAIVSRGGGKVPRKTSLLGGGGGHGPPVTMSLDEYFSAPFYKILKGRLPWLIVLLIVQSFSATILASVDEMLEANVVVTLFIPMLVGTGGNAGNQPGVMVTRALASGKVPILRLFLKEAFLGALTAAVMAGLALLRVYVEFRQELEQAIAISLTVLFVVFVAIMLGISFSLILDRGGCDPAAGAAPMLTTISDLVGICILAIIVLIMFGSERPEHGTLNCTIPG